MQRFPIARGASAWIAGLVFALQMGGCPGTGPGGSALPLSDKLFLLSVTDAVAGGKGVVRVSVGDPVRSATSVALTSSNPSVLAVPSTITIPSGATSAEASFDALSSGQSAVRAEINGSFLESIAFVLQSIQLDGFSGPGTLQTGAADTVFLSLNLTAPANTTVNLSSSDSNVVSVPSTVTIAEFDSSISVPIVAGAPGVTVLTARIDGSTRSFVQNVVENATLTGIFGEDRMEVGGRDEYDVELNAIVASDTVVSLTSSDPSVMAAPQSVTVPAGSNEVSFELTAIGPGLTTLTASLNGSQVQQQVSTVNSANLSFFSGLSDLMLVGASDSVSVALDAVVASPRTVTLTSSDPNVLSVAGSVIVQPGNSFSDSAGLLALNAGTATITATLDGSTLVETVAVVSEPTLDFLSIPNNLLVGAQSVMRVFTDVPVLVDTSVSLQTSNANILNLPATVTIPAGSTQSSDVPFTAMSPGIALVTATLGNSFLTDDVEVSSNSSIFMSVDDRMQTGLSTTLSISLDVGSTVPQTITLTSSDPNVLSVPSTVTMAPNNTFVSLPVTAGTPGVTTVRAELGTASATSVVTVVSTPLFQSLSGPFSTLQVGVVSSASISLDASPATEVTATITTSANGIISAPSTITLPTGSGFGSFPVTAVGAGTVNLFVTILGQTRGVTVTTTNTLVPASVFFSPAPKVGGPGALFVSLNAIAAAETTVMLSQTNAAALSMPNTLVIPAGRNSFSVPVTGLANAMTTVTATLNGTSVMVNVTPAP